jgi:hypothetical protein
MSLYKYVPPERLDILRSLRVRFTQPGAQNDPFELRPVVDRFRRSEVARQGLAKPLSEEWDRQFSDKILKQFGSQFVNEVERIHPGYLASKKEAALAMADAESDHAALELIVQHLNTLGIFSLSEVPDDLLMWAHYAANHTGFVLEFDDGHAWFWAQRPQGDDCGVLKKVSYADEPSSRYLAELKAHEVFYTKGTKWEYEREWRIIRPLAESSMSPSEGVFLFDVPAPAITGVIAGLRTSSESLQELQKVHQSNHRLTHLRIGRISEVKNSNTLEVVWA